MDKNTDEYEELAKDPEKLLEYLSDRIGNMSEILDDDENFCNQDIETTKKLVLTIEEKFLKKIQERKDELEQLRLENEKVSKENKDQFTKEIENIHELFSKDRYQAWKKFKDYEQRFQQRTLIIKCIPKLHMNDTDIEQYFSSNPKPSQPPSIQPTNVIQSTIIKTSNEIEDSTDEIPMTNKERRRKEKVIETVHINKDDEEVPEEKSQQIFDNSLFGIRSKRPEIQPSSPPATTTSTISNETLINNNRSPTSTNPQSPTPTNPSPRIYRLSNRIGPSTNNSNLPFSGRKISAIQNNNINSDIINYKQTSPTSSSMFSIPEQYNINLSLNPVSDYQHERNILLLMACNSRYIVLFKSRRNRLDQWQLGAVERASQIQHKIDWHDGLIISMGYINDNNFYMFTEREFFIYSLVQYRKMNTRMLKHGNDDGYEVNNSSSYEYQRGIGTVYDNIYYHIYLNRNSRWALSRSYVDTLSRMNDIDLVRLSDNVLRFIHLCVNDKTINYLVQMDDLSYAVIFSSKTDFVLLSSMILPNAKQPLTICSAYIKSLKCEVFFINDPSIDILHILTIDKYLQSCPITVHAICYVAEKHELMIVTNNAICSINLNNPNLFS